MDLLTAVLQTILQQEPFCGERLIMRVQQKPLKSDVMVWDDIALGRYGGINEDFVLVDGWGECEADGSQEMVEGVGKALV
jgi:hypothetical protein